MGATEPGGRGTKKRQHEGYSKCSTLPDADDDHPDDCGLGNQQQAEQA